MTKKKNPNRSNAGAPTELTGELRLKIRELILEGLEDVTVAQRLEIPIGTFKGWKSRNYKSFADDMEKWDLIYLGKLALGNTKHLLCSDDEKIRNDITKFVLSTLRKDDFSTRIEQKVEGVDLTLESKQLNDLLDEVRNISKRTPNSTENS
jgi:hypothetical protein